MTPICIYIILYINRRHLSLIYIETNIHVKTMIKYFSYLGIYPLIDSSKTNTCDAESNDLL